ncbi:MAG TPA: nitronate monooxygenase, partial [Chitinophagaceae bacterium]|nr:nitronate monooxygenase [Chitinophagaceae bacterium]
MIWENEVTKALGIKYPIIQAPMLGVTTPEMVAAVCQQGGLGSLPVGGLSPEKTRELIRKTKAFTPLPFAVNLFANQVPINTDVEAALDMQELLRKISIDNNFDYEMPQPGSLKFYTYTDQIDCLLEENVPVVSFTFGALDASSITALKQRGTVLIGTATCLEEAEILDENGIDMITAQGIEAGGHRGTFLEDRPLPMIGLIPLITTLTGKIKKPIIAAGGIGNGKALKAA